MEQYEKEVDEMEADMALVESGKMAWGAFIDRCRHMLTGETEDKVPSG